MCKLCEQGHPQAHGESRRTTKAAAASAATAASAMGILDREPASADHGDAPEHSGHAGRRYVIRHGSVMSMDSAIGDFAEADVLVDGKKIAAVGPNLRVPDAAEIDARGRIVMPGFIDTHHHLFETALRSYLADGLLMDSLDPATTNNYFQRILLGFAPVYRPKDVHISTLFGSLSSLDAGVTTVCDISQIHHSPEHSDASLQALRDSDRRAVFGYFESAGSVAGNQYPTDARRIRAQHFSSNDQLLSMVMGGEIYLPGFEAAWSIGRELGLPVAAHIVGTFGMRPTFDTLASTNQFGPDNLFIHMTGMSDLAWQKARDAGAAISLSVPIEMNMRHGTPPIQKALDLGFAPSLSTDVECTLTADMFTQMRTTMALQKMFLNGKGLGENGTAATNLPPLLRARDMLNWVTMNGARALKLDHRVGSLTPGKEADIVILDAEAINVAPLNHVPGAVVTLMERTNVETVIVAGKVRKWKGRLLDVDLGKLRRDLAASRDDVFAAAGIAKDLYRTP
jgi:5-methylthioadenosine/S-adenosylhomocysteine deaminase